MPLFAYFTVVGSILLGLLYVAEARLGPPKNLSISTNFHGLPEPWKSAKAPSILTVRDAPVPEIASAAFAQATLGPRNEQPKASDPRTSDVSKGSVPSKTSKVAANKTKKTTKPTRDNANRNMFAHSATPRSNTGIVW